MSSFLKHFISIDDYGEPVSVSYKGDSTYKTPVGAVLTLGMRLLMLIFTIYGVLKLTDFQDPQITQYTVFDNRSDGREFNLGES